MSWIRASLLALMFLVPVEINGLQWFPNSTMAIVIDTKSNSDSNVDDHSCLAACLESANDRFEFDSTDLIVPLQQPAFLCGIKFCFFSRGPPAS